MKYATHSDGSIVGWTVDDGGLMEHANIWMDEEGFLHAGISDALADDGFDEDLVGWGHARARSFNSGRVLVALA